MGEWLRSYPISFLIIEIRYIYKPP